MSSVDEKRPTVTRDRRDNMRRGLDCTYTSTTACGHAKDIETDPLTIRKEMPSVLFGKINPLNPELNPICYLLALLGAHHFLHVSRIRVKL